MSDTKAMAIVQRIAAKYKRRRVARQKLERLMRELWRLQDAVLRDIRAFERLPAAERDRLQIKVWKMRHTDERDFEAALLKAKDSFAAAVVINGARKV